MEKRISERINVNIPAKIICSNNATNVVEIESINNNGFLCSVKKNLPLKESVKVMMLLPEKRETSKSSIPMVTKATVLREKKKEVKHREIKHYFAVKFTDFINNDEELRFRSLLSAY